ncbi:MAG: major capsid protein [Arizlama microvirus]|nr:MAG: major capsid protein [Arizlama microvirus]
MGKLVPVLVLETLPGDSFRFKQDMMARLMPLVTPAMDRMNVEVRFFDVPNRLIWDDFEKFITGGKTNADTTVHPFLNFSGQGGSQAIGSLADYIGIPTGAFLPWVDALPFRAYDLICNEWYFDKDLQTPLTIDKGNGLDTTSSIALQDGNWELDYFTGGKPTPQRGAPVTIPLTGTAPVTIEFDYSKEVVGTYDTTNAQWSGAVGEQPSSRVMIPNTNHLAEVVIKGEAISGSPTGFGLTGEADMQNVTALSINDLRQAEAVQQWMEKNIRSGFQYIEMLWSHFNVSSDDARFQRPEFLGAFKSTISISEVLQTSQSEDTPQGNLAGHAYSAMSSNTINHTVKEHGWVIAIMNIMPRASYQQGLHRQFTRKTKYDYYWPLFANLGEQAVLKKELFADGSATDEEIFSYVPRYDEYRQFPSSVHGEMRDTLDHWHTSRQFASCPALNDIFIKADPTKRIFADENEHTCLIHLINHIDAIRPIPKYGIPKLGA